MRALLIRSSYGEIVSRKGRRHNRRWAPLSLMICGALLEKEGLSVTVIDQDVDGRQADEIAQLAQGYDHVFVNSSDVDRWQCPNLDFERFVGFVSRFRNKEKVYLMGAHGTLYPEQFLKMTGAKAVIRDEPEWTVKDIACGKPLAETAGVTFRDTDGTIVSNPARNPGDLNALPAPALHLIDVRKYYYELMGDCFVLLEGSRGCSFHCTFCSLTMYGNGVRTKSPEKLFEEVCAAKSAGAKNIYFIDLEFTINKKLVQDLCKFLIERKLGIRWTCQTRADLVNRALLLKMKESGCVLIHYGVESGSQHVLDNVDKRLTLEEIVQAFSLTHESGIETTAFFMFGLPGETPSDRKATLEFAKRLNPTYASFHLANPYPMTELWTEAPQTGLFPESFAVGEGNQTELENFMNHAFLSYYVRPTYLMKHLASGNVDLWRRQFRLFLSYLKR